MINRSVELHEQFSEALLIRPVGHEMILPQGP